MPLESFLLMHLEEYLLLVLMKRGYTLKHVSWKDPSTPEKVQVGGRMIMIGHREQGHRDHRNHTGRTLRQNGIMEEKQNALQAASIRWSFIAKNCWQLGDTHWLTLKLQHAGNSVLDRGHCSHQHMSPPMLWTYGLVWFSMAFPFHYWPARLFFLDKCSV